MASRSQEARSGAGGIPSGGVLGGIVDQRPGADMEKHLGHRYDSKQVSRIVERATSDLEQWRTRRLEGRKYKFLYLDGAYFRVRINKHVSKLSFCAVLGVSEESETFEVLA